jgi:predicted Abi (CAAX) family protease
MLIIVGGIILAVLFFAFLPEIIGVALVVAALMIFAAIAIAAGYGFSTLRHAQSGQDIAAGLALIAPAIIAIFSMGPNIMEHLHQKTSKN